MKRTRPHRPSLLHLLTLATCASVVAMPWADATFRAGEVYTQYAVATDHRAASEAGASVLASGGNAVDAAVAAALAVGVVNPASSGFGGGGFATVCRPNGECVFLDFREIAPAALTVERLRAAHDPRASVIGGLAVGVPGEPAGLLELSQRYGRIPLRRTVAPVARLAREGFAVSSYLADQVERRRDELIHDPTLSTLLLPGGMPIRANDRLRRPRLAQTLERFGAEGERFVHGAYAEGVAAAVAQARGVLTREDVAAYRPRERAPLRRMFRDHEVVTAPPPSAGGMILLETLAWIDASPMELPPQGSSAYDHLLAEAWRGAYDDRARYVGDTDDAVTTVNALLDPARIAQRRAAFRPDRVGAVVVLDPPRDHGTSHICVVDADGMIVSMTSTVNLPFGARIAAHDLDVVLNDEIDDFSLGTVGNNYGMAVSSANALAAGRRPVSSMAPTVVLRGGHPIGCVGASGGGRIPTATSQALLNLVVFSMTPEAAVSSPRIHHQGVPDRLFVDHETPEDVRVALRARGHDLAEMEHPPAVVQALWVRTTAGHRQVLAASDPRKGGVPAGR